MNNFNRYFWRLANKLVTRFLMMSMDIAKMEFPGST